MAPSSLSNKKDPETLHWAINEIQHRINKLDPNDIDYSAKKLTLLEIKDLYTNILLQRTELK